MSAFASGIKLRLHVTISVLFITIVVSLGALLSVDGYNKTSEIILSSAEDLHAQISNEAKLRFRATYRPVVGTLKLLALSPLIRAGDKAARIENLMQLTTALSEVPATAAIQVGYPNGDYFVVRPLRDDQMRARFDAPGEAGFVVDDISVVAPDERRLYRSFYDARLGLVHEDVPVSTDYDPRQRPWYQEAQVSPVATQPYLFHFMRKVGTTVAVRTSEEGVVIASDVSLEQFSETIARHRATPSSEAVIMHSDGRVLAYPDAEKLIRRVEGDAFGLAHIADLGSAVLEDFSTHLDLTPRTLDFEHRGRRWVGSIDQVARQSGLGMSILLLSPVDELLSDAVAISRSALLTTLLIIALSIPVVWLVSTRIAGPMRRLAAEADAIRRFDFDSPLKTRSMISEVDALADAMRMMKQTINQFLSLISSLAGEKEFDSLLGSITRETMRVAQADAAVAYLVDDDETRLRAEAVHTGAGVHDQSVTLPDIQLAGGHPLVDCLRDERSRLMVLDESVDPAIAALCGAQGGQPGRLLAVPLRNRQGQPVGVLCLVFGALDESLQAEERQARIAFVNALSGFSAVSIESRHLMKMQAALLDAFIKLIAGAIDSKSPYTGGHCQRVPELARMLAEAACTNEEAPFADFDLDDEGWEALHIASWLHDCGKVTTPEYVVDKSTKLETIYDRIHEIRMRFEVLKRDAQIRYWELLSKGGDRQALNAALDAELARLDDEFAFVAECNEGGEFMSPERLQRLRRIARRTWMRTLNDRIGISWEERQRKEKTAASTLPVAEKLIDDKPEHLIERPDAERMPDDNPWGFRLDVPEYQYNRGELHNLAVARGTLSDEERFKINDHVVQTIIMLSKLPYPKHLRAVPEIAGGHHETMDGKGYPRRLKRDETSLAARIMAIADIFEALTASDRPYKQAKTLSEAIHILSLMERNAHIDPDLFRLFLQSGVWKLYAERFLDPAQIDRVDIEQYLV